MVSWLKCVFNILVLDLYLVAFNLWFVTSDDLIILSLEVIYLLILDSKHLIFFLLDSLLFLLEVCCHLFSLGLETLLKVLFISLKLFFKLLILFFHWSNLIFVFFFQLSNLIFVLFLANSSLIFDYLHQFLSQALKIVGKLANLAFGRWINGFDLKSIECLFALLIKGTELTLSSVHDSRAVNLKNEVLWELFQEE